MHYLCNLSTSDIRVDGAFVFQIGSWSPRQDPTIDISSGPAIFPGGTAKIPTDTTDNINLTIVINLVCMIRLQKHVVVDLVYMIRLWRHEGGQAF